MIPQVIFLYRTTAQKGSGGNEKKSSVKGEKAFWSEGNDLCLGKRSRERSGGGRSADVGLWVMRE